MGLHYCAHPCWHRALILFGAVGYWYGSGLAVLHVHWRSDEWFFWMIMAWLVSTWLFKHLLQWRCQGREASDGRKAAALLLILGSAALLSHDDDDY
jgi:hypothetical protein